VESGELLVCAAASETEKGDFFDHLEETEKQIARLEAVTFLATV
jgi:hypothetical protein